MDTNYGVIEELNKKLMFASESLAEANEKNYTFRLANTGFMQANAMLNEGRKDCENARRETAQLANRMADIAQDVIAKPSDPQSLRRSLRRLGSSDVIFSSDYVPNSMNVLNKVKEAIPRDKFKAKHNKITLLENYTKEQLMNVINATMTERQIARLNNMR
ncbi:Bro-b-repeat protein [Spilosoma obliqua nucleopolyhedrosis virus]|nr:Bro-b-repeat protein [Spilosoma obliqua nucleopolyhedrosis virus]